MQRLTELAENLDGALPARANWEADLADFNQLADTSFDIADFQGIYGE